MYFIQLDISTKIQKLADNVVEIMDNFICLSRKNSKVYIILTK